MATFGFQSIGGSSATTNDGTSWVQVGADTYTASTGDTITSYTCYVEFLNTDPCELAAYDISASVPQTRVGTAASPTSASAAADWYTSPTVSHALSNGVEYGVGMGKPGAGNTLKIFFDSPGGTQRSRYTSSGTLPATWTENATSGAKMSMYATYTTGGGGGGIEVLRRRMENG